MVLSAPWSNNHYDDDSDSGEEELDKNDLMPHLNRCITLCEGNPAMEA